MRKALIIGAGAAVLALGAGGATIAAASGGGGDSEGTVTGTEADAATQAALKATGGGTANAVERDDEAGAVWEVEVTKPDGSTVDVRLDADYNVVVIDPDNEDANEADDVNNGSDDD